MIHEFSVPTDAQAVFVDITHRVARLTRESGVTSGEALVYVPHTTCGLTIQENSDPGVPNDMLLVLNRIVPRNDPGYLHLEDNSASHLQASMMGFSLMVFIQEGALVLGQWQAIYLAEFDGPRTRRVLVKIRLDE